MLLRLVFLGAFVAVGCTTGARVEPNEGLGHPISGTSGTDDGEGADEADNDPPPEDSDSAGPNDDRFDVIPPMSQPSGCSADLRDVLDETGAVVSTCEADEGCLDGQCVPACDAVESTGSSLGCAYQIPTPPVRDTFLPPCHAVFVANSWVQPATVELQRDGVSYDVTAFGRIAETGVDPSAWLPIPDSGIPVGEVAVLFVSGAPDAAHPATGTALTCPVAPAMNVGLALPGSGRSAASSLLSDTPLTVYDIVPFGGALSFIPSATLLFPEHAWGENYLVLAPPVGTSSPAGPLWMQIVGAVDGTTVTVRSTTGLTGGPGLPEVTAGVPVEVTVDAGETIQWESGSSDPTGSVIAADQPIAVLTGSRFLQLQTMPEPGGESAHQMLPAVSSWASNYAVAPYETRRADLAPEAIEYRIIAAQDGTQLSYDPPIAGAPAVLDAGQDATFATALPFVLSSQDNDHPVALAQIMATANLPGGTRPGTTVVSDPNFTRLGDEEYVVVLPPAQFLSEYRFFTDPSYGTSSVVVTRVRVDEDFHDVTLECFGTIGDWEPVGSEGEYETARVDIERGGVGTAKCVDGPQWAYSDGPFGLVVWGADDHASYAYPAGGRAATLNEIVIPAG